MPAICVIDIGGTHTRCALYERGRLISPPDRKHPTPNYCRYGQERITANIILEIQRQIVELIVRLYRRKLRRRRSDVKTLAIGFPGPVTARGMVRESCVIFGDRLRRHFDLHSALDEEFRGDPLAPEDIFVTNDITAAAWRYSEFGYSPFCLITVSSGVGNKIFANNRVMIGPDGLAGEIGHVKAAIDGIPIRCSCGFGENHVGMISSGRGIEDFAARFAVEGGRFSREFRSSKLGKKVRYDATSLRNELIAQYADRRDHFARKVIDVCTLPLAEVICYLAAALYIRKFILIGGFSINCNYYLKSLIQNVINTGIYNFTPRKIRNMIIYGCRDDNHTLIGLGKMFENRPLLRKSNSVDRD